MTAADVINGGARWCVVEGDAVEALPLMPAGFARAVVTDPPAGVAFMGAEWDRDKGGRAQWVAWLARILAAARVACADGSRAAVWALPRTSHWTGCAVEDAGWSIETKGYHLFGCLTPDTEILVNGEWVSYDKATPGNLALCYDSERDSLSWKPIGELVTYEHHQHLYRLRGEFTDQLVTRGHRCPVYRDGRVVFLSADEVAEGGTALVPVLEDVRRVLAALPLPQCARGVSEDVRGGVSCGAPANAAEDAAPDLRDVRGGVHAEGQQAPRVVSVLLGGVLREVARGEPGDRRAPARRGDAGQGGMDGHVASVVPREDDRAEQPRVEGRRDARVLEGELRAGRVRALPDGVPFDGAARRVDSGTQAARGAGARTDAHDIGERASRQSQPAGQPAREPDALRDELGSQEVRASRFARADLVRVSPEHHDGIVWCVTVPTGAFVARRNGQVFITGNTGWPKGKSQLKPAAEEWIFARTGRSTPLNIDACRVGSASTRRTQRGGIGYKNDLGEVERVNGSDAGRYPPNVTLGHADGCVLAGVRRVASASAGYCGAKGVAGGLQSPGSGWCTKNTGEAVGYADPDGTETVDAWECVEGCAVRALGEQSGELTSGAWDGHRTTNKGNGVTLNPFGAVRAEKPRDGDTGTAARFFPQFEHEAPFLYCAKPSRAEKRAGLDDDHARHPTVKPVALMRWLIRLTTQPGDIVLDPFTGSGTTGVAALAEGRRFIGVERDPAFAAIARARMEHAAPSPERLRTMTSTPVRVDAPDFGPLFGGVR